MRHTTSMVHLDLQKAFDSDRHNGLIHKMIEMQVPTYITNIVAHYLKDRTFKIRYRTAFSEIKNQTSGVLQGSVLGPILFLIFINDIPGHNKTALSRYADDMVIYTTSRSLDLTKGGIKEHLLTITKFLTTWKLNLNDYKNEIINFNNKTRTNSDPQQRHHKPTDIRIVSWCHT